jgi:hypothetical protein
MRQAGRWLYRVSAALLTLGILLLNLQLYSPLRADYGPDRVGADVAPQPRPPGRPWCPGGGGGRCTACRWP